jgi:hypothetical protein
MEPPSSQRCLVLATTAILFALPSVAADRVTFDDDIIPIFRSSCLKCHNPDKLKGELDLSTFGGVLKGGGSGLAVVSGDASNSKLIKAITHAEEPEMPPKSGKIPDKEIETIRRWIAGGLLETSGSKAVVSKAPKVDMTLKTVSKGRPEGAAPMPGDLLLEPVVHAGHGSAITGLAASPWAPLIALGGQKQVLLYHSQTLELVGVLPHPEGFPSDLKFSRSGKLLIAGGGRASKSGEVIVWDVATGNRLMTVGEEFDSVLAADITADQSRIALGGPGKLVKIYTTRDGELQSKIKKHTDWVTALEFSPDGEFLASGDRNGGVTVFEADNGHEVFSLNGHKAAITAISWRADSDFLATSSEDGTVKVWQRSEAKQAESWTAHGGGALSVQYSREGSLVSCGRDNRIIIWDGSGKNLRAMEFSGDLPVRARFSDDGKRVIATDWSGAVGVWNAADGKRVGALDANPPAIAQRIELAGKRIEELQTAVEKAQEAVAAGEAEVVKAESGETNPKQVSAAKEKLALAKTAAQQTVEQLEAAKASVPKLRAAEFFTGVWQARAELAAKQAAREKAVAEQQAAKDAAEKAAKELAEAKKTSARTKEEKAQLAQRVKTLNDQIKSNNSKAAAAKQAADKAAKEIAAEQARVDKLTAEYERVKTGSGVPVKSAKL